MKNKPLLVVLLFCLFLTACSQKTDITFYTNQTWKYQATFSYDPTWINMAGDTLPGIVEGLGLDIDMPAGANHPNQSVMDELVNQIANQYRDRGLNVTTRRKNTSSREVQYQINITGRPYELFHQISPGNIAIVQEGENQYHLQMTLEQSSELGQIFEQTVTIHTGGIISSNATMVDGNAAIWRNNPSIDLVFTPVTPWGKFIPYILAAILGVVLLSVIARTIGKKRCASCGARVARQAEFCNICGAPFQSAVENPYQGDYAYSDGYTDQTSNPRRGLKIFITIVVILIIVVVVLLLLNR